MFNKIAVATDGSPTAMRAVKTAADLAVKYGSEIIVLHVLMHGEIPEALERLAITEHLVEDEPPVGAAVGSIPGLTLMSAIKARQSRIDENAIVALGDLLVNQAKTTCRKAGVSVVDEDVMNGDCAEQIILAIKRHGADLIVIGARGLGPLESLIKGSVSQKIARDADVTCLIVK